MDDPNSKNIFDRQTKIIVVIFLIIFLGSGSLFLLSKTVTSVKSWDTIGKQYQATDTIVVTGKGEELAKPDTAEFTFSVIESDVTVQAAQEKSSQKTNAAISYLKTAGINENDIKTLDYYINPKYEYRNVLCPQFGPCPNRQVLTGYEVSEGINVKIHDTSKAGAILAGIGGLGVQNVSGLQFTVASIDSIMNLARSKAIQDAKQKADALAQQLDVHLARIVSFTENNDHQIYPMVMGADKAAASTAPAPDIQVGQNKITSNVTITYEIR